MIETETVAAVLAWARTLLADQPHAEPLDAPVLLAHVLGVSRAQLIAHPEQLLAPDIIRRYRDVIARRAQGMPVAYLTGQRAFYDRELAVTPAVLIPRPETEHLLEAALRWARTRPQHALRIADIGTGSGAIAVTLAAHLPAARVWAVDVSPEALAVARENARSHGVADRVQFRQGDLLAPLLDTNERMDLIAANLPYIPTAEVDTLAVTDHEPRLALDGGPDGLALIRRLLASAPGVLAADGLILLEIMAGQGEAVAELARRAFPAARISVLRDYAGHDRVVHIDCAPQV